MGLLTQQKYLKMVVNFVWSFYEQAKTDEQNDLFSLRPSFTKFETLHVVDYADLVTAYSLTILTHVGIVFGYPDTMAILRPSVRVVNDYAHD